MKIKEIITLASVVEIAVLVAGLSGCEELQSFFQPATSSQSCTDGDQALNVGFYAYFSPVSYSEDEVPASAGL